MNLLILVGATVLASVAARTRGRPTIRRSAAIGLVALLVLVPALSETNSILFDALTAMCIAYGWNVIGGYTGYAAFGNVAYLGLGAYVAAGFMSRQPGHLALPWFVGIPLSVVIVSLAAFAVGLAVLRLRGHYFSIATLGVAIATPQVVQWDLFFGPSGAAANFFGGGRPLNFPLAADIQLFGVIWPADRFFFYYLGLATALIAWGVTAFLRRSKFGYALLAIRENEEAAEVMGVNTTVIKSLAYVLSAALAALGGAVIGYRLTNMTTEAEALFSTTNNLQMIVITLIGGPGTVWGPAIGGFILFGIQEALRTLSSSDVFLQWQAVVFSLVIIFVVLFLPRGLMQFLAGRTRVSVRALLRELMANRV
jgi:branched-chain amino acid transport system permease protein